MRTCEPVALRIAAQGARLEVEWSDGPTTPLEGARLRAACNCEECRRNPPREGIAPFTIQDAETVGASALRVKFTDRHQTVFTLDALRALARVPVAPRASARSAAVAPPAEPGPTGEPPVGWSLEGAALKKTFTLASFSRAIAFLVEVACLAETANHHPDVDVRYNKLTFSLTTHDSGRVTEKDVKLALMIEGIAP
jgi:4a-hydroxytetrahydrobiopterin dehydratase